MRARQPVVETLAAASVRGPAKRPPVLMAIDDRRTIDNRRHDETRQMRSVVDYIAEPVRACRASSATAANMVTTGSDVAAIISRCPDINAGVVRGGRANSIARLRFHQFRASSGAEVGRVDRDPGTGF